MNDSVSEVDVVVLGPLVNSALLARSVPVQTPTSSLEKNNRRRVNLEFLPPAYELCRGFVFTSVCLSTVGGLGTVKGGSLSGGSLSGGSLSRGVSVTHLRILLECIITGRYFYNGLKA